MNEIETLQVVRTRLEGRDADLAQALERLEREREIVRREMDLVEQLLGLEAQRGSAESGPLDDVPSKEPTGVEGSSVAPAVHAEPPWTTGVPSPPGAELTGAGATTQLLESEPDPDETLESARHLAAKPAPDPGSEAAPMAADEAPRDSEMLGRIEQLRRLRASLVVGGAVPGGRGD